MKNLLIYISPFIEQDRPNLNNHWVDLTKGLIPNLLDDYNISLVLGEVQNDYLQKKYASLFQKVSIHVIWDNTIGIDENAYNQLYRLYNNTITEKEKNRLKISIQNSLGKEYIPQYVLFFMNPVSYIKELYPNAKFIGCEAGGLFQQPFPKSWYFDVFGDEPCSYIKKYSAEIRALKANQQQKDFVQEIRDLYYAKMPKNSIFKKEENLLKHFKFNVLLPLQVSNIYSFDLTCPFKSQFHYLKYVLDNISPEIGVIVTEHPFFPQMNSQWFEYFSRKYKNFIYIPKEQEYFKCSEMLISYCDAVLNVSSTVAFLALWWKKPLIALGDNYFTVFSDFRGLKGLKEYLEHPVMLDKDAILYHLINNYWVLDKELSENKYLHQLISQLNENTEDFNFYKKINRSLDIKTIIKTAITQSSSSNLKIPNNYIANFPLIPFLFSKITINIFASSSKDKKKKGLISYIKKLITKKGQK